MRSEHYKQLQIHKYPPVKHLEHLVSFLYVIESSPFQAQKLKVPASLYFDLILPLEGQLLVKPGTEPVSEAFVSPVLQSFKDVVFAPRTKLLGIRIRPEAFIDITQRAASDLIQGPNLAQDFFDPPLIRNIKQLFSGHEKLSDAAFQSLQQLLLHSWKGPLPHRQETLDILRMAGHPEVKTAGALATKLGYSMRWLQLKTKHNLGLSPKQILDLKRLSRFFHPAANGYGKSPLTETGLELGFYDQSHFIRSMRKISGESPARLLKSELTLIREFIS